MHEPFVAAVPKGKIIGDDVAKQLRRLPMIQYTTRHHMGRLISERLEREGVTLTHRFELDSYHAIMAMIADGAGWSILTPLGWMRAGRFRDQVDLIELPFAQMSRTITLTSRKDALSTMPSTIAARLGPLLQSMIVDPAVAGHPWLAEKLRLV
jgi:DNA-binding transcriptional LysR family regulator